MDLTGYLIEQQSSFCEVPSNDVDSLILCSLSYLNFDVYPLEDITLPDPVPIIDVLRFSSYEKLVALSWLKDGDDVEGFLTALAKSRRYRDLSASLFALESAKNIDKQFSAVMFCATGMLPYVAFRGTDGTIAGWKEDFNLAYKDVIPSHIAAQGYLSGVLSMLPSEQHINVGGHSKGGNLAEFATACIDDKAFTRIDNLYNHDGPAFLHDPSPRYRSSAFAQKRHKTIPESSIFGMILEKEDDHRIVLSTATSIFQHRPLTWIVEGNDFAKQDELNDSARLFDDSLDKWLRGSTPEQREIFLDTIFSLMKSTDADTLEDLQASLLSNLPHLVKEGRNVDDETKAVVAATIARLFDVLKSNTMGYLRSRLSLMMQKLPNPRKNDSKE